MSEPKHPGSIQLTHDQFQAAIKASQDRFALLRQKHPSLKGYLVLSLPGGQTGIGSSSKEILTDFPAMVVDDDAKAELIAFLKIPEEKEASEAKKRRVREQYEALSKNLNYDASVQVEIRFARVDYELIWKLQADDLVDHSLTPKTRASIGIVLGTLAAFTP